MSSSAAIKDELRRAALARRDELTEDWRNQASASAAAHGLDGIVVRPGTVVAGFLPIRSEIDPLPLMEALMQRGAALCLPCIVDAQTIVFRRWRPGDELQEMQLGTRGPRGDAEELTPDIMLMPLAAFDAAGARIGYGGGFYDRAIERMAERGARPRLIGMAFACQEVASIPTEKHDIAIGEILTEAGLRKLEAAAALAHADGLS